MKKVVGWLVFVVLAAGVIVADYFLFRWYKPLALAITLGFYKAFLGDLAMCLNKRLPDGKKIRPRDAFTGNKLSTLFSFLDFFGCAWCGSSLYVYMTKFSVPAAWKAFAFWLIGFIGFILFHHLCCKLFGREPYEDAKEEQEKEEGIHEEATV